MLLTIAAALALLGIVILVHELGHFLVAKAVGIGVLRFSIGFGAPTPIRFQWGETEYVVAWIPLGGYVKMATREEEGGVSSIEGGLAVDFPPEKLFENKPLWARILVLLAGVAMNVVLAWALYAGMALTVGVQEDPTTRVAVVHDSLLPPAAAELASLPFAAWITRINDDTVASWNDIGAGILDIASDRLRFDFAGGIDPIILPIPGTAADDRYAVYQALEPLWEARIAAVTPGRPASRAGIEPGDLFVAADGDTIRYWGDLLAVVEPAAGDTIVFTILREGSLIEVSLVPDMVSEAVRDPRAGGDRKVGFIGVAPQIGIRRVRYGPIAAAQQGWSMTVTSVAQVAFALRGLILRQVSPRELGGPIFIAQLSGQMAQLGIVAFLSFMAFISINLAIFNLLPIPVLDGGHLVFLVLEGIRGKPVSVQVRMRFTQIGLALLLALVVFVVYNDLVRVVGG